MRGADSYNEALFSTVKFDELVPASHPLRPIRTWMNDALAKMDARFSAMYESNVQGGPPCIAPEKLMRAMLLQVLYSIRSERQFVEQISYKPLFEIKMINNILKYISEKYKSPDSLQYSFKNEQHLDLLKFKKIIGDRMNIEDTSDINYDVSDILFVSDKDKSWLAFLSWIGPFSLIMRTDDGHKILDHPYSPINESEKLIIESLNTMGYQLVGSKEIYTKIQAKIPNSNSNTAFIYQLLFSDTDTFKNCTPQPI